MPKFLGLFSKRGFATFLASCFLATEGAGATFFPLAFFPLGCGEIHNNSYNESIIHTQVKNRTNSSCSGFKRFVLHKRFQVKKFNTSPQEPKQMINIQRLLGTRRSNLTKLASHTHMLHVTIFPINTLRALAYFKQQQQQLLFMCTI